MNKVIILILLLYSIEIESAKIAVFDSGINNLRKSIQCEGEHLDFTENYSTKDPIGHGTYISGFISGSNKKCPGLAPNATLSMYRVFDSESHSKTEWLLEAFNRAIYESIDIINFSMGDYEFYDLPLRKKVEEVAAHGIVVVAAVGNDGPRENTIRSPADMACVLSVGSLDLTHSKIADFTSRGHKIDVLAPGKFISGDTLKGDCVLRTGTSISTALVSATIDHIVSQIDEINIAVVKQIILETSVNTKLNSIDAIIEASANYQRHVSIHPLSIKYSNNNAEAWNVTILNPFQVSSWVEQVLWSSSTIKSCFSPLNLPIFIWPWSTQFTLEKGNRCTINDLIESNEYLSLHIRSFDRSFYLIKLKIIY